MTSTQLPQEFIRPDYQGSTIANVPATVAALFRVPFNGLPPLYEPLRRPLAGDVKRVVVVLLDSLGWNLYRQEEANFLAYLPKPAVIGKTTSIFPSTTVAALSSLWTGAAPAQHGLVGLRLFFPDLGVLGQMLSFSPTFARFPDSLIDAGVDPQSFLQAPGFAQQLANAGIPTYSFKGHNIIHSALSKMHDRGVAQQHGAVTSTEMFVKLHELLENTAGQSSYSVAYWPTIDTLSHIHGPLTSPVAAELKSLLFQLKTFLLDRLSREARQGTVLIITADHGQVRVSVPQAIDINNHPELKQMLFMRTAGEPRTAYLYARQGYQDRALSYLRENLGHALMAVPSSVALEDALLGPEPHAADVAGRVGDILVTMRQGHLLLNPDEMAKTARTLGRHGGMTAAEMEVPWLGYRLDG